MKARILGPRGPRKLLLALDTASGHSLLTPLVAELLGYQVPVDGPSERIATVTEIITRPLVTIREVAALGTRRRELDFVISALPRGLGFHGLLGLDFLRGTRLTIDFRRGEIDLDA